MFEGADHEFFKNKSNSQSAAFCLGASDQEEQCRYIEMKPGGSRKSQSIS